MEHLVKKFVPQKYHLQLEIDKWAETVCGKVTIKGLSKARKIYLHAVKTEIKDVRIRGRRVDYHYSDQEGILEIVVPQLGETTISVEFENKLRHSLEGAYISTYQYRGKEQRVVITQFESHFARKCFPCVDEPAAKAVFELEITQVADKDIVLSNMPVRKKQGHTTIFEPTPRMSTYLLAFVIGEFREKRMVSPEGIEIASYCVLNQKAKMLDFANEVAAGALEYYGKQFDMPYPLKKLDQVALPDFDAGAMENWGLVTYREICMLADNTSSQMMRQRVAMTVAHELAHQWFGNLVTPQWWDELWLNESFASSIEYYAVDALFPEYRIWDDFWTNDCWAALRRDALPGVQAVQQPVLHPDEIQSLFDPAIVYAKGARLMVMLIRLMGKQKFLAGIRDYFKAFAYQNTTGDDLWRKLQKYANFKVKDFMHTWIAQPGFPMLTAGKQQRFLLDGTTDDSQWPLPEVTDDMTGHYILNLTKHELTAKLAHFDDLSLEQRLRIIMDRILLSKTQAAESVSLFEILDKCSQQTNSSVWEMLIGVVGALRVFGWADEKINERLKKYVANLVKPKFAQIVLVPEEGESLNMTQYRDNLLALAYYAEVPEVLEELSQLYDDDFTKIHPELIDFVLGAQIKIDEKTYFARFLKRYVQEPNPEFRAALRGAMTEAKQSQQIKKLVKLLQEPEIIRPQDHLFFYLNLRRNPHAKTDALDWLLQNWDYVCEISGDRATDEYPRYTAGTIHTRAEAEKFYAFFDHLKHQRGLKRSLQVAHSDIEARLRLIKQDGQKVQEFLAKNKV